MPSESSPRPAKSATARATSADQGASVCGAWAAFVAKMYELTPKAQYALVPYAQAVEKAAIARSQTISRAEFNAVFNLVGWVGNSQFSYYGNIESRQYTTMEHYCPGIG